MTTRRLPQALRAIINAHVLPMTRPEAEARAIAWEHDTIVAVGSNDEIQEVAASAGIEPEDADGRVILPGFVDAHMHFLHVGLKRTRPDLRGAKSKQEALDRLALWTAAHPGNDPVTGEGWDESDWDDPEIFHREELDAVAGGRPVVLRRICGHVAVANTAALPAIVARWGTPPQGVDQHPTSQGGDKAASDGNPLVDESTGRLIEAPSLYLNEVLPATPDQLEQAIERACAVAHQLGVTTVGDYEQAPFRAALERAAHAGRLRVRIVCSIYLQHLEQALADGFCTGREVAPMMHDGGLKLFLDGSIGGHTASMLEPYDDHPGRGLANLSDGEIDQAMVRAHDEGVQIHAHAIGDGAVEQGLRAYERLAEQARQRSNGTELGAPLGVSVGDTVLGHRFEHFEIVHDAQVTRAAALGIWASSQPNFVGEWSAKGGMYETRIGDRYRLNNRFRTFLDAGMRLAFGSDGMPFGPLFGIASAVGHPDPDQRMTARQAVWHYTHEAAASLGRSDIGSLVPGNKADILMLAHRDLDGPATGWVLRETILGGQTVHRAEVPTATDDDARLDA